MPDVKGLELKSPNGIRLTVIGCTPNPEEVIWYGMHQCYAPHFSFDDDLPKDPGGSIVRNLLKRSHFGPLEHANIVFNIGGVSRALMAQLTRHRTGISFDVQSLRYTKIEDIKVDEDSFTIPPYLNGDGKTRIRFEGGIEIVSPEKAKAQMLNAYSDSLMYYTRLVEQGVPPEDARFVLPLGLKINMVMSANARTIMHLLDMRMPPNAQWEIRELSELILQVGEQWIPEVFNWYRESRAGKHKIAP